MKILSVSQPSLLWETGLITVSKCLLSKALLRDRVQGFLPWEPVLETPGYSAGLASLQAVRDSWQCLP